MNSANPTLPADAMDGRLPQRERTTTDAQASANTDRKRGVIRRAARAMLDALYQGRMRQAEREISLMHLRLGEDHPTVQAYRAAFRQPARD